MLEATQCECMDGPNHVDATCLYCGGTGVYASDERLAQLVEHYTYLVENSNGIGRRDFTASDRQHIAIFKALQIARDEEMRRVKEAISRRPTALSIADTVASEARAAINKPGGENDSRGFDHQSGNG